MQSALENCQFSPQESVTEERLLAALNQIEILQEQIVSWCELTKYLEQKLRQKDQDLNSLNDEINDLVSKSLAPQIDPRLEKSAFIVLDYQVKRRLKHPERRIEKGQQWLKQVTPRIDSSSRAVESSLRCHETPVSSSIALTEQEQVVKEVLANSQAIRNSLRQAVSVNQKLVAKNIDSLKSISTFSISVKPAVDRTVD